MMRDFDPGGSEIRATRPVACPVKSRSFRQNNVKIHCCTDASARGVHTPPDRKQPGCEILGGVIRPHFDNPGAEHRERRSHANPNERGEQDHSPCGTAHANGDRSPWTAPYHDFRGAALITPLHDDITATPRCGRATCGDKEYHVTSGDDSQETPTPSTTDAPRKPARRRVTRTVSAPTVEPVSFLAAEAPAPTQRLTTAGGATVRTDTTSETPAPRRSRRATSDGKTTTRRTSASSDTQLAKAAPATRTAAEQPLDVIASLSQIAGTQEDAARTERSKADFSKIDQAINLDAVTKKHGKKAKTSATTDAESADTAHSDTPAPARTTKRTPRRATKDVFAPPTQPAAETPAAPVRPRLATTALLFQAPEVVVPTPTPDTEDNTTSSPRPAEDDAPRTGRQRTRSQTDRRSKNRSHSDEATSDNNTNDTAEETTTTEATTDADSATDTADDTPRRRRRRGSRGRKSKSTSDDSTNESSTQTPDTADESQPQVSDDDTTGENDITDDTTDDDNDGEGSSRRRRRRRRTRSSSTADDDTARRRASDEVTALKGSTRLEAKRQRRREGRDAGRRRTIITEAEFLARRESVDRSMVVREVAGRTQIAVLEDGILVEHYVSQQEQASIAGNVYLGRVQNVLPSMEAAFVDIGKGRNAVLYAGEVNWDVHGIEGQPRRIEEALKSGDSVLVQVTKDPIGHKGARLTSQITLAGRYLVYVPGGGMTGISRKLPDTERARLKRILKELVDEGSGVIVRTAAEGASETELRADVERLKKQWAAIEKKRKNANAPALLQGEPDLAIRVVRDIFNDDFTQLSVQGDQAWGEISEYVGDLAPDLANKMSRWTSEDDIFAAARIDEQLAKGLDRKVYLPSGGSLVIDRTEAMTVIDVNTGKFTGTGGTLEETVTRNNLEAAEEIVRQLRLRDIGGIIVIDFIDMVLESNRDLVLRRLVECLGRDRTKHQVAEVTSLGLVQMTRKRVGQGLIEAFSTACDHCSGRGYTIHTDPVERHGHAPSPQSSNTQEGESKRSKRRRSKEAKEPKDTVDTHTSADQSAPGTPQDPATDPSVREDVKTALAAIAAAAAHAHDAQHGEDHSGDAPTVTSASAGGTDSTEHTAPTGSPEPETAPQVTSEEQSEPAPKKATRTRSRRASRPAGSSAKDATRETE